MVRMSGVCESGELGLEHGGGKEDGAGARWWGRRRGCVTVVVKKWGLGDGSGEGAGAGGQFR